MDKDTLEFKVFSYKTVVLDKTHKESLDEDFNLENDLNKMREKMIKNKKNNIDEYIKKVREFSIEYRNKLNEKIGRNKERDR